MTAGIQEILACCGALPGADSRSHRRLRQLLDNRPNAHALVMTAAREGMSGLLYRHLRSSGLLDRFPGHLRKKMESGYYRTAGDNLRLLHDFRELLDGLNRRNIPATVLQGMALLDRYGDIGLRPMNDIDLWVMPEDLSRVDNLLLKLDYKKDGLYAGSYRKGSTKLDLRTHLLWADRIRSRKYLLAVNQTDIFRTGDDFLIEGRPARRLMPHDEMVYLTLHALKHFATCMIWLVDLRLVTNGWTDTDWRQCLKRATQLGQAGAVSHALFLLHELFGVAGNGFRQRPAGFPEPNSLQRYLLKQKKKSGALPEWAPLFLFRTGGGLKNRLQYLFEHIFPRPAVLRQVFPERTGRPIWLLYAMRILQLYGKAIRSIASR